MKMKGFITIFLWALITVHSIAQKITISGKATGEIAKMLKEVQFVCDGKMQKLEVNKEDQTFSGDINLKEPQFVEINAGNPKPIFYYLVPNEKVSMTIDKPSLQQSDITLKNSKIERIKGIVDTYFHALEEQGIDLKARDWQQLLFVNNEPLKLAEKRLSDELAKQASFVASIPNFKKDMLLFMKSFRNYTTIDNMSLPEIEKALQEVKSANLKITAYYIPFMREYLTDLSNAYAARTLEKYNIAIDAVKQRNIPQFMAAECIEKYVTNPGIKSNLFSDKLKVELPTNGLKNEAYVNYLLDHSEQSVRDGFQEKIDQLRENKVPDLNAARKKAFNFLLHDEQGKEYRLADFKGKILFVDFWASWCAPCKMQIPYQKELEKHYAGKDITFMSVSLDRSKEAWLKAAKEEDLHGYVLHAEGDFKNEFPKAYGIEAIPRYMLIDAEGNIISDNMMKPQNKKEIMGIIDEELYAKNTTSILEKHFQAIGAEKLMKNGLILNNRQSVITFNADNQLWYSYPDKLKITTKFEETEQMRMIVGKDFFKETVTIMNGDEMFTNNPNNATIKENWVNKLQGFELFLRKSVNNVAVKFAEENGNATDSSYVLKLMYNGNTEKYYINKQTWLIEKVVIISGNQSPRKGGGTLESFAKYEDYRDINGVMIPFKVNQNNLVNIKTDKAELKQLDVDIFKIK